MLPVYYSDFVELPLPEKHVFPRDKYRLARELVALSAAELAIELRPAPLATDEQLLRVHTADYVRRVHAGELTAEEQRAIGFPWSPGFVERSLRSTGATIAAADFAANENAWAAHLAGGTHHASADRGQGFCVFNDIAVAIRQMQQYYKHQFLVLDCDVHQGNGTAEIFAGDANVFTCSIHGAKNFPLKKAVSDLDLPLDDGCDDATYLPLLNATLAEIERRFTPTFVFYISGADPYVDDRYGRMALTKAGLVERDRRVFTWVRERALPLVTVMGGGYARNVGDIAEIYANTIMALAESELRG